MSYAVEVTQYVTDFIIRNVYSERVYVKIYDSMRLLGDYPELGRAYAPEYPAAAPPFPCRSFAVPDTPFTLFYTVDPEEPKLTVFYIENQAMNPKDRFLYGGVEL